MWHLYYHPESGDISALNKKKLDMDLPYLRIDDDLAEKFFNFEHRYIDWQVVKQSGRYKLTRRENKTEPVWYKKFNRVKEGTDADVVILREGSELTWQSVKTAELSVWVTIWNNPLKFIGSLHLPNDKVLLVPPDQKISIFTNKNNLSICYHDKNISC